MDILSKRYLLRWLITWGLLGVATGVGLSLGDTGHLPASWILIIVPVSNLVAGLAAVAGYRGVLYLLPARVGDHPVGRIIAGAIVGAISVFGLGWFVLGVQGTYAMVWGATAGVVSVGIELRANTG
jgi:hypothetical protein